MYRRKDFKNINECFNIIVIKNFTLNKLKQYKHSCKEFMLHLFTYFNTIFYGTCEFDTWQRKIFITGICMVVDKIYKQLKSLEEIIFFR